MKSTLTTNWHAGRIFRLALGIAAVVYAFVSRDSLMGWAGGWLMFLSITNTGCCGMGGCQVQPPRKTNTQETEEVKFEEIK